MKHNRVILVAGPSAEAVDPIRRALEQKGIFAVACCDLNAAVLNGKMADLEIACCAASASAQGRGGRRQSIHGLAGRRPANALEANARLAEIARHPVPVVFVHERPSVEDVNYLRSCGAYYVIDRRADERQAWRRLLECVEQALAGEVRCSFCGRRVGRLEGCVEGTGQARLCRDCLLVFARHMLAPAAAEVRYAN